MVQPSVELQEASLYFWVYVNTEVAYEPRTNRSSQSECWEISKTGLHWKWFGGLWRISRRRETAWVINQVAFLSLISRRGDLFVLGEISTCVGTSRWENSLQRFRSRQWEIFFARCRKKLLPSTFISKSCPHMICQNDPWTRPSVKMTFPDPLHEEHQHM